MELILKFGGDDPRTLWDYVDLIGSVAAILIAVFGAIWAIRKAVRRSEHHPRVNLQLAFVIIGSRGNDILCELRASIDNRGNVPIRMKSFQFNVRSIDDAGPFEHGGNEIRHQAKFPNVVKEGSFIPENWSETFVHPNVKAEYDFSLIIPSSSRVVRAHAFFSYNNKKMHHQTCIVKIPKVVEAI